MGVAWDVTCFILYRILQGMGDSNKALRQSFVISVRQNPQRIPSFFQILPFSRKWAHFTYVIEN
jgi:hypothetical protein